MIILKFYFSFMTLLVNCKDTSKNDILIVGRAENDKEGAWVISSYDKKGYLVDGIYAWDEKTNGKIVKVWGKLLIEELKEIPRKQGLPIPQQMIGIKRTILKARWKLVK
jgi:hypothetical protein